MKNNSLSNSQKYIILLIITQGLKYLHSQNIICGKLTKKRIFLDKFFHPHLYYDNDLLQSNDKYQEYSFKNDIFNFSLIAYELLTNDILPRNNHPDLTSIKDPKIREFFRRCCSKNRSLIPQIFDIYNEIRHKRYITFTKTDVNEKIECESKLGNLKDNQQVSISGNCFRDNMNINYCFSNDKKTLEIIQSPDAKRDFVPEYVWYGNKKYFISKTGKEALAETSIKSLSFSLNSKVNKIEDYAFSKSSIEQLYILASIEELGKNWCFGAEKLKIIEVDSNNIHFQSENGILI